MTYDAHETSIEGGRPVEVYRFQVGATAYFYTSAEDDVTLSAQEYEAIPISRGETTTGANERDADFSVTLPTSDPVAQHFVGTLPGVVVRLTVRRYHRGDTPTPQVVLVFDGEIESASFSKNMMETTLVARAVMASHGQTIPPRTFQASCNHELYNPLTCKVDDTSPAFRASNKAVTSQVGNLLTVAGLGAYAPGWFTAGFVESVDTGDFRMVLDDDGAGNLTLLMPFPSEPVTVNVFAGCSHLPDDPHGCGPKFNNGDNFGGFPAVPTKNPFESGVA